MDFIKQLLDLSCINASLTACIVLTLINCFLKITILTVRFWKWQMLQGMEKQNLYPFR
jgi:hypothetical protein